MGYAIYYGPTFALACIAYLPVLMTIIAVFGKRVQKSTIDKLEGVKLLSGAAEESLTAIKVVASYC